LILKVSFHAGTTSLRDEGSSTRGTRWLLAVRLINDERQQGRRNRFISARRPLCFGLTVSRRLGPDLRSTRFAGL